MSDGKSRPIKITRVESRLRTIYCPYTDQEINEGETSKEHIIPLSLGGVNGFEIPVRFRQ